MPASVDTNAGLGDRTSLMMHRLFDVGNGRSARRRTFLGFLEKTWLLAAIAFFLGTHFLVICVPALQAAFHTVRLSLSDGLVASGVASMLPCMELAKIGLRTRDRRLRERDPSDGLYFGGYRAAL